MPISNFARRKSSLKTDKIDVKLIQTSDLAIHSQSTSNSSPSVDPSLPTPRVPVEILDRILELALLNPIPGPILVSHPQSHIRSPTQSGNSNSFMCISGFALASITFRLIALRRYFRSLNVTDKMQYDRLWQLLTNIEDESLEGGFEWVRTLSACASVLAYNPARLASLAHLRSLSIDFMREGFSTQHAIAKGLCQFLLTSSYLTSLTLNSLPRIDTPLLVLLTKTFPSLVDLYLSCTERLEEGCCWTCFEDSYGITEHSPIPDMFSTAEDLADTFAIALKPLTNLTHLHLGIFLSDERLVTSHLYHADAVDFHESSSTYGPDECPVCWSFGAPEIVRRREMETAMCMAQKLKAIKSIGWSSFFNGTHRIRRIDEIEEGDLEGEDDAGYDTETSRSTTIWVLRRAGRIRVKRTPW